MESILEFHYHQSDQHILPTIWVLLFPLAKSSLSKVKTYPEIPPTQIFIASAIGSLRGCVGGFIDARTLPEYYINLKDSIRCVPTVPTSDTLGRPWTDVNYDDSQWPLAKVIGNNTEKNSFPYRHLPAINTDAIRFWDVSDADEIWCRIKFKSM